MNEIVHADIFFFITSIAVIVIAIGLAVLLYYAILIARDIQVLVARAKGVEREIEGDIEDVREVLREEGVKTKMVTDSALGLIASLIMPRRRRLHHRRTHPRPSSQH